jgi:recombinational DNA repair protein RecR
MKTIQELNSHYNSTTLRKQFNEKYGQLYSINEYEFGPEPSEKKLFDWQLEAIDAQANKRYGITIAPCGSGKTLVVQTIAAIDAVRYRERKQVILVSESSHADNFTYSCDILFKLKGQKRKVSWAPPENFTEDLSSGKTKEAKNWLLSKNKSFFIKKDFVKGSVAVMTHALFNRVFQSCSQSERKKICENLTIMVDESHHLKGIDENQDLDMTKLSEAVNFIVNNAEILNCKVFLCTATHYRGDYAVILSKENLEKFTVYQLEFVRHFLSLGIENYNILHSFYNDDPIKQIAANLESCLKKGLKKHYVVVPPNNENWNGNWRLLDPDCSRLKKEIVNVLSRFYGYDKKTAFERILDLVKKSTQKTNKRKLSSEPKYGTSIDESQYDVVITCRLCREGTDWPICSVVHNASPEKSPPLAVQTAGRVVRKHQSKQSVVCYYYIKNFIMPSKNITKEDLIADRVHYLILTMLMDEYLRPILLPISKNKRYEKHKSETDKTIRTKRKIEHCSMRDIFAEKWDLVKRDIIKELSLRPCTENNVERVIDKILSIYPYNKNLTSDQDIRDGLKVFVLKSKNSKFRNEFVDVSFIRKNNFNKICNGENESLFYQITREDWKTFQILKEDALEQEEMNLLCKQIPEIKAKELNMPISILPNSERYASLRELYDFRDACVGLEKKNKSMSTKTLAKILNTSENVILLRISGYNKIFRNMGKQIIKISA